MGRTVVVGGGVAGLAAAYTLEKGGADCTVLEKRDFAGGRTYSVIREGFALDLGAQFFFSRYHSTFALAEKLGIADQLVKFKPLMGILRDDNVFVTSMNMKDNLKNIGRTLQARKMLSKRGSLELLKFAAKLATLGRKLDFDDPLKAIELDNISFTDYARRHFSDEVLEYIIQPVASTLTLGDPEETSAAYGMALAWYIAPGLSTFRKGIGYISQSLAAGISDLKLETSATRIVLDGKKVKGVEFKEGKKKQLIEADDVVCATLGPQAAGLIPDLPRSMLDTLESIRYSASVLVLMAVSGRPMGDIYAIATPRREGLCFSGITDSSLKAPGYSPPNTSMFQAYTYGKYGREMIDASDAEIQERVTRDIQRVVPQFPDEPLFCEIFRWPEAVNTCGPGQITAVQRLKVALRDYEGLHLAGEYLGMPSVEAAVNSGVKAAEKILRG